MIAGLIRFAFGLAATFAVLLGASYLLLRGTGQLPAHLSFVEFAEQLLLTLWRQAMRLT